MVNRGRTIEDARDYGPLGCVEPNCEGREYGWHDAAFFNLNKVLELAINNGRCVDCATTCPRFAVCAGAGSQLGLATGSLADFTSFEEVKEAYEKQMHYWVDRLVMAAELGLTRQVLVLNRAPSSIVLPALAGLPPLAATIPTLSSLAERQLASPSVLGLPQHDIIDRVCGKILAALAARIASPAAGGAQSPSPR